MSKTVLLFEDTEANVKKISDALKQALPKGFRLLVSGDILENVRVAKDESYEDCLEALLKQTTDLSLIVCDRDLSNTKNFTGLSEVVVSSVAARLGIPVCLYARGLETNSILTRQREWGDGRIVLKKIPKDSFGADEVSILAEGFEKIASDFKKMPSGKKAAKSPAELLARLLGKEELSDQFALFGSGDQRMAGETFPAANEKVKSRADFIKALKKRMPSLLGYWLYNSVLRFPGILMNETAAASYLNIDEKYFSKNEVRELFQEALYKGPFSSETSAYWWRSTVDAILTKAKSKNGNDFVATQLKRKNIPQCFCSVNKKINAGYYCMMTHKPISYEESKGNISWFPQGASLARVNKDIFEEIAPWVGLY